MRRFTLILILRYTQISSKNLKSQNEKRIFIISTHQVHDIENLIDHIVLLEAGKIMFNHPIKKIAEHFTFSRQVNEPGSNECLYYEKHLGGYSTIHENRGEDETEIDLEILFNAVLANNNAFEKILQNQSIKED